MDRLSELILIAAALTVVLHGGDAVGQSTQAQSRHRALAFYHQGNEAFRAGQIADARHRYLLAWKLSRTFDIACNLGRAEAELELWTQAAQHLAFCLDHFTASSRTEFRDAEEKYRALFVTVRRKVGALDLRIEPAGASVFIDSKPAGRTPLSSVVWLTKGRHKLAVEAPGRTKVERIIDLSAGDTAQLHLALVRPSGRSGPYRGHQPGVRSTRDKEPSSAQTTLPERIPSWVLVAGGAATVLASVVAGVAVHRASSSREQVEDAKERVARELEPGQCSSEPTLAPCTELERARSRLDTVRAVRDVALVSAVMLGTTTLVSGVLTFGVGGSGNGANVVPLARPISARINLTGRF